MLEKDAMLGPILALLSGAFIVSRSIYNIVAHGYWGEVATGSLGAVLVVTAAIASSRRSPISSVMAMYGLATAVLALDTLYAARGVIGLVDVLEAPVLVVSLVLSRSLLSQRCSGFQPARCRSLLLAGGVFTVAAADLSLRGAWLAVLMGLLDRLPLMWPMALSLAVVASSQLVLAFGVLRMRGLALLGGIGAAVTSACAAIALQVSIGAHTFTHAWLFAALGCSFLAAVVWTIPLVTRNQATRRDLRIATRDDIPAETGPRIEELSAEFDVLGGGEHRARMNAP